ncbi:MAG TPA: S41 family peptidase, partial [Solirubrobacteraceae bacterium]|nr:S41 family peptidase [Solirubrobacteraceae bacterium]
RVPRRSRTWVLVALLPILLVAGIWLGGHPGDLPAPVRDTLVADSQGRLYDEAVGLIERDYYRPVNEHALLDTSLDSAVASLHDRFSNYFSPKDYQDFSDSTDGAFTGVGMTVEKDPAGLKIISVFANSPAKRGGLRPGDTITEVNGHSLQGSSSDEATTRIKGPEGSSVTLTLRHDGAERTVNLQRQRVEIPVVQSSMKRAGGQKVAYVRLSSFTSGAHAAVGGAVRRLLGQGAKGVVLDLRDNGGGLLNEAVLISSIFIPDGTIVSTRGRARPEHTYDATGGAIPGKIPVTVLVNRQTASASEIVTGSLQDRHRASVVGTRTFGKGVFQEVERLSNGGALDITVGEYFLPSGRNLGGGGVKPGSGITPDVQAPDNPRTRRDETLQAGLKALARAGA